MYYFNNMKEMNRNHLATELGTLCRAVPGACANAPGSISALSCARPAAGFPGPLEALGEMEEQEKGETWVFLPPSVCHVQPLTMAVFFLQLQFSQMSPPCFLLLPTGPWKTSPLPLPPGSVPY